MGKMVSATEFKAKSLALIDEMQRTGEPLTVTRRGKPSVKLVAESAENAGRPLKPVFGLLRSDRYRFDIDPSEPAADPDEWDANNPAELYRRL